MKLDRNSGVGKYAIIKLRNVRGLEPAARAAASSAIDFLHRLGCLDYGEPRSAEEFFVIRLRDKYALKALDAYANTVSDPEYAREVFDLASRAGPYSPFCKEPD